MKIALVHDYLVQYGGAERVLRAFADMYPDAPIYTLLHDADAVHHAFDDRRVYASYLQRIPGAMRSHRLFPPLMPSAIEQFDFRGFDVVLSDSSSYAKGILTPPETLHISYVHTPMRYAWDDCHKYAEDFGFPTPVRRMVPILMNPIRLWDKVSADRVDRFVANSGFVARRIRKYYGRDAVVINPPVDVDRFSIVPNPREYFLMVGRLISYKRYDIAIEAMNQLRLPLKIIGRGPEEERLRKLAGPTIEFLGRVPDDALSRYYAEARAFLFPQEEDFGIVAIEALASGRPVIAFRGGDVEERITDGVNGILFDRQTPEALGQAVRRFEQMNFDPVAIRRSAERFDKPVFQRTMGEYVTRSLAEYRAQGPWYDSNRTP